MTVTRVAIAGSSGSIGTQTLDVIRAEAGAYEVVALSVAGSATTVIEQAHEFRPRVVAVTDETARAEVRRALPGVEVIAELAEAVELADVVVNGVVGFAGLDVTLATLRAGRRLALANKESLIAAGPVVAPLRNVPGAELVPVDSEHGAIHQCLRSSVSPGREVARLVLTASGGPFRGRTAAELADVTVEAALAHPTWSMGPKITIDSSTLMNKGLEVIEAHWLFGAAPDQIEVVIHPQSVIHSMVSYADGSVLAQLGNPDMRTPIAHALAFPERIESGVDPLDFTRIAQLNFREPDYARFPCLKLAFDALRAGGSAATVLNAANEVAVEAFLGRTIGFRRIPELIAQVLDRLPAQPVDGLDSLLEQDCIARDLAWQLVRA